MVTQASGKTGGRKVQLFMGGGRTYAYMGKGMGREARAEERSRAVACKKARAC